MFDKYANGMQVAPAYHHSEGHRTDTRRFSDIHKSIFHWVEKQQPTPGAKSFAFESLGLVEFSPIGPGIHPRALRMRGVNFPQSYIQNKAISVAGYGGVLSGGIVFQPLYDPNTNTYGGVALP